MLGVQASFAEVSERTLRKACGLRLSESTVERTTEGAGERLAKLLEQRVKFGAAERWEWERDARGRTCAYVSLDATGVRQQGPQGAAAEGRMAYVGMIYNPRGAARTLERRKGSTPHQVRYLAGFYELEALGLELRGQAAQVGWDQAQQQIAISDGGAGLEDFFRQNFPLATVILDFWHAKEHLVELGQALFGDESPAGKEWLDERCHQLKAAGGAAVRASLEALDVSARSPDVREAHRRETNYFRNHEHKMDYPPLANRRRPCRERLQNGRQQPPRRQRHALGITRQQRPLPPPRPLPQPTQPMGNLLERLPKLTTNVTPTRECRAGRWWYPNPRCLADATSSAPPGPRRGGRWARGTASN